MSFERSHNHIISNQKRRSVSQSHDGSFSSGSNSASPSVSKNDRGFWKQYLYVLQQKAPAPQPVLCSQIFSDAPVYYGGEFHGSIERERADFLLQNAGEGSFLVRESQRATGSYTLCMRFNGRTQNYKLFYDGQHFVGEKRFDNIEDLVADGLISMYLEMHAGDYIRKMTEECVYEESPYSQYQKRAAHLKKSSFAKTPSTTGSPEGPDGAISYEATDKPGSVVSRQASAPPALRHSARERRESQNSARSSTLTLDAAQKAHKFKCHTFRIPHYCDYCGNFMWGLVQQGVRCEDCGFAAHKKCAEKTLQDCRPDLRYVKRMFAVDLTTLCMAHRVAVPPVVEHCIYEIERRALDLEGVYRVSGSHDDIEKLRLAYDTSCAQVDLSKLARVEDIHTIAGLLKLYLRLLPQPLITFSVYRSLTQTMRQCRTDYDRIKLTRRILDEQLPPAHSHTLRLLMGHLRRVTEHSAVNKMSAENLARIFTPTLLCAASPRNTPLGLAHQEQYLLQFLILQQRHIFDES